MATRSPFRTPRLWRALLDDTEPRRARVLGTVLELVLEAAFWWQSGIATQYRSTTQSSLEKKCETGTAPLGLPPS